jgi:hypothetical protein
MKTICIGIVVFLIAGFGTQSFADDSTPKLHPVEAACIDYEMSGQMQKGTSTRCHRDFAYEQFDIQQMSIGFGGFSQKQNMHNIVIGNTIYAINLDTNSGTKTINPMYEQIVSALQDAGPEEMAVAFIAAMGFTTTGESRTIAGTMCEVYSSAMVGTMCLTKSGLLLQQSVMGNTQTAVKVSIGDGGDDADYELYLTVPITEGPDLSNMPSLQDLMNMGQPQ